MLKKTAKVLDLSLKKIAYAAAFTLSLCATLLFFVTWWKRRSMPYNEVGRFFDGSVVWHEQAVGFYLALAVVSLLVNVCIALSYRKNKHRHLTSLN